ncbi:hypothetical protein DFP72DRAFT_1143920 [Ephemerocybe angulata]|uniref:Uncharacterized protein n=1 Tax=Ephemerocybe angulata TaxID=980116 RepID=A0A8H6HLU6_9AGAR|nr:hypothetical protein DFP72DRAFT_1143920 [Tulosesus angulatus]
MAPRDFVAILITYNLGSIVKEAQLMPKWYIRWAEDEATRTIPVPQTPVTNPPLAVLRCGPPDRESCPVSSPFVGWLSTPEDSTLGLPVGTGVVGCQPAVSTPEDMLVLILITPPMSPLESTRLRTIQVTQDAQDKGARDSELSAPDVISLRIDDFNTLQDQARRGETVICRSERVDTALEAILSQITWNGLHIDKSSQGAPEIFDVISRILEALPTVESEKKLPATGLVKKVAGAIGDDIVENLDTSQGRNSVAKTQVVPYQQILAAPLESELPASQNYIFWLVSAEGWGLFVRPLLMPSKSLALNVHLDGQMQHGDQPS